MGPEFFLYISPAYPLYNKSQYIADGFLLFFLYYNIKKILAFYIFICNNRDWRMRGWKKTTLSKANPSLSRLLLRMHEEILGIIAVELKMTKRALAGHCRLLSWKCPYILTWMDRGSLSGVSLRLFSFFFSPPFPSWIFIHNFFCTLLTPKKKKDFFWWLTCRTKTIVWVMVNHFSNSLNLSDHLNPLGTSSE